MRYTLILCLLFPLAVCGCAKVHAQSDNAPFHSDGDKCKVGNYFGHFVGHGNHDMWALECVVDDGKPPRLVPGGVCLVEPMCAQNQLTKDHWECGKGYELDGFKVTWPDGTAKIEPERCKARKWTPATEDGPVQ